MKTIIHVCKQTIARNRKNGANEPPLIVRTYKGSKRYHEITIDGPVTFRHSPHKPLSCGARVWAETHSDVYSRDLDAPLTEAEIRNLETALTKAKAGS